MIATTLAPWPEEELADLDAIQLEDRYADWVKVFRMLEGRLPWRRLNEDERMTAVRVAVAAGWTDNRMCVTFRTRIATVREHVQKLPGWAPPDCCYDLYMLLWSP